MSKILYLPFDGDYEDAKQDDIARLATDLLGNAFTDFEEICLSFDDGKYPDWMQRPPDRPRIRVEAKHPTNSYYNWDKKHQIPENWTAEQVEELLYLGNVYVEPAPADWGEDRGGQ